MDRFGWSLGEVEGMIPFELEVYLALLDQRIQAEQEEQNNNG